MCVSWFEHLRIGKKRKSQFERNMLSEMVKLVTARRVDVTFFKIIFNLDFKKCCLTFCFLEMNVI